MNNFLEQAAQLATAFKQNTMFMLILLSGLLIIQILNWALRYRLNILGILPRSIPGLIGILFSSFLHGDFKHFLFNMIPLFVLGNFILLKGALAFYWITGCIIVFSGIGTWLLGRRALHVGSSDVIMGYFSYLLIDAYRHPSLLTIGVVIVSLYYFGGLFLLLVPGDKKMSWEAHIFGFIGGILTSFLLPVIIRFFY